MPSKNASLIILVGACLTLIALNSRIADALPLWLRGILVLFTIAVLPLAGRFGVFRAIGISYMPGAQSRPRPLFASAAFFAAACVWAYTATLLVPDSLLGALIVFVPAAFFLGAGVVFLVKGIG
jgi:hypothetical protein